MLISFLQLNTKAETPSTKVIGAMADIKRGEIITKDHLTEIDIDLKNRIECYSAHVEDFLGKTAYVDISKGALLCKNYFFDQSIREVPEGKALTAIKLLPDSAICWTTEPESILEVYFIDQEGVVEVLGEVKLVQVYDQNMNSEDMLFYAVVEGHRDVVTRIIQKRALGRIEIVKTQ